MWIHLAVVAASHLLYAHQTISAHFLSLQTESYGTMMRASEMVAWSLCVLMLIVFTQTHFLRPTIVCARAVLATKEGKADSVIGTPFEAIVDQVMLAGRPIIARNSPKSVFDRIPVSVTLPADMVVSMKAEDPTDLGVKLFVNPKAYLKSGERGVLYGVGVANDISFEARMATMGCEAFAFDCTSPANMQTVAKSRNVTFRPWCVGKPGDLGSHYVSQSGQKAHFKSLTQIVKELKHDRIDILKTDIEGYEWNLFENEILSPSGQLPMQLMFEVHLEGTNPMAVPPAIVRGRGPAAFYDLMDKLLDRGYRVIYRAVNPGDSHACELTLMRFIIK